jgi:hypothetical protein
MDGVVVNADILQGRPALQLGQSHGGLFLRAAGRPYADVNEGGARQQVNGPPSPCQSTAVCKFVDPVSAREAKAGMKAARLNEPEKGCIPFDPQSTLLMLAG